MAASKKKTRMINTVIILLMMCMLYLGLFASCSPDDPVVSSLQELAFEKLSGDWSLNNGAGSIVLDGVNVSANYPGFSLAFDEGTYTTNNAFGLFKASGTWQWLDEGAQMLVLDDGKEVTLVELNELRFTFSFTYNGGGVRAGIPGNYNVSVVK